MDVAVVMPSEAAAEEVFQGHPVTRTREPMEAREAVSRLYAPHRLDVLGRGVELDARLNAVQLGGVTAGYVRYGAGVRLTSESVPDYLINIPLSGRTESCSGREAVVSGVGQATVFLPNRPGQVRWAADCAQLSIRIIRHALDHALGELLGQPIAGPIEFATSMDMTTPASRTWLQLLNLLEQEYSRPAGMVHQPAVARHLERLLMDGLLLAQPHNLSDALTQPPVPARPRAVRQAIGLIEGQADRMWTVADLAKASGTSVRSLQEGFKRNLGTTPMSFLRDIRLARVHEELSAATPESATVTAIAHRWGFVHLGHFTAAYRRKFGDPPSHTLRAKRR